MDELFTQAPEEVARYFDSKGQKPSFDWRDVAPAEHAHTFTVAKTVGYDVLDDLRDAVGNAVRNQVSYEDFAKQLTPILQEKGWWGKGIADDPADSAPKYMQLGSPRRLRTIYWANVSTARAAGEWERTQRTKDYLPFLRYGRSTSENRRLEHASWEGVIARVDDPWWDTHYPPNGWGCECPVRQLSAAQAEREGYTEGDEPPEVQTRSWLNKRTGERQDVPIGIDPGWAHNPGKNRQLNAKNFLSQRLEALPEGARRAAVADLARSVAMRDIWENRIGYDASDPRHPLRAVSAPVALLTEKSTKALKSEAAVVSLSAADAAKIRKKHPEVDLSSIAIAQQLIENGEQRISNDGKLILLGIVNGSRWIAAIKHTAKGELFLNSLYRTDRRYFEMRLKGK